MRGRLLLLRRFCRHCARADPAVADSYDASSTSGAPAARGCRSASAGLHAAFSGRVSSASSCRTLRRRTSVLATLSPQACPPGMPPPLPPTCPRRYTQDGVLYCPLVQTSTAMCASVRRRERRQHKQTRAYRGHFKEQVSCFDAFTFLYRRIGHLRRLVACSRCVPSAGIACSLPASAPTPCHPLAPRALTNTYLTPTAFRFTPFFRSPNPPHTLRSAGKCRQMLKGRNTTEESK